jgi:hypothetical protein
VWDSAATQLLEYRTQHHITDTKTALGPPPRDHKAMRDYTGALTAVTQAAQKLGHQATKPLAPDLTQQQHAQQLEREALHRTRSRGLER